MTPYFHSLADFFAMGTHGLYVWSCYGLTLLAIIGLIAYSISQRKASYKNALTQQARQNQRRNRSSKPDNTTPSDV